MKENFNNPQLTRMLQIAVIVRNVDESIKIYEEHFGIGPWEIASLSNGNPVFKDMTVSGSSAPFEIKCAMCACFGLEIELIEPVTDGPYRDWLDKHGPGLHHIAFLTRDNYQSILARSKELTGKDPWIRGQCEPVGMDFSYLDFTEQLGMIIEIYGEDSSEKKGNDY